MNQHEIIASAHVPGWRNVYVLGSFDSRITFYSQQVRGFNLAFALSKDSQLDANVTIAIVGAGAAGISAAAGIALLLPQATIKIFDRAQSTLHLQRGCAPRNLHPHIYDWPDKVAFQKEAGLPYLNWSENSADAIAKDIGAQFDVLLRRYKEHVTLHLNTTITALEASDDRSYLLRTQRTGDGHGDNYHADVVIFAVGFGLERELEGPDTISYWSPQGMPDGPRGESNTVHYVVSGSGDGALVDLLAAALDSFDHTALITRITGAPCMEEIEDELRAIDLEAAIADERFDFLAAYRRRLAALPACVEFVNELVSKVRIQGQVTFITKRAACLNHRTSTLNRFMVFLIFQAAAKVGRPINHVIGELKPANDRTGRLIAGSQMIEGDRYTIRHGNDQENLLSAFADIKRAYKFNHEQWLREEPQRARPPKLAPDAESVLREAVQTAELLNLAGSQISARPDTGWHQAGPWSCSDETPLATYLFDDSALFEIGLAKETHLITAVDAIDRMREWLSTPKAVVRMIGHSGVGKTRLAQSIFDDRIGNVNIPEGRVYYADNATEPSLSAIKLATMLVQSQQCCVLVVDNCSAQDHAQLTSMANKSGSKFSVLTIDYEVEDDLPANTEVLKVDGASNGVIADLLRRRHTILSQPQCLRLAHLSAGNAKVALSLAEVSTGTSLLSELSDNELFRRLVHQTYSHNQELEIVAGACALLCYFNGESLASNSDLHRLGNLTGLKPDVVYRHVNTLMRRKLVIKRGSMRGFRLQAMANSLALRALEDIHPDTIKAQLEDDAPSHLISSFARRLSYLEGSEKVRCIVKRWLAPGGRLGDLSKFDAWKSEQFSYIAPRAPADVLTAIQRLADSLSDDAIVILAQYSNMIGRLAYEAEFFPQCMELLTRLAVSNSTSSALKEITKFCSVIVPAARSTIQERMSFVARIVDYRDVRTKLIARAAIEAALGVSVIGFHSYSHTGFQPPTAPENVQISVKELSTWFRTALSLLNEYLSKSSDTFSDDRNLLLKGLNTFARYTPDLVPEVCKSILAATQDEFWYDAWRVCNEVLASDLLDPLNLQQVRALRDQLCPYDLEHKVLAILKGGDSIPQQGDINRFLEEQRSYAISLGRALASHPEELMKFWPQLQQGTHRAAEIGAGLALERTPWETMLAGWTSVEDNNLRSVVLKGYLTQLAKIDYALAVSILDACLQHPQLLPLLPSLQVAVGMDQAGAARLLRAFATDAVPDSEYSSLIKATHVDQAVVLALIPLLEQALISPIGFSVAARMVSSWVSWHEFSEGTSGRPALHLLCRTIVSMAVDFEQVDELDYEIAQIVGYTVSNRDDAIFAKTLVSNWRAAANAGKVTVYQNQLYKGALLRQQPVAVLESFYHGTAEERKLGGEFLRDYQLNGNAPLDKVPASALVQWCAQGAADRFEFAAEAITLLNCAEDKPVALSESALLLLDPVFTRSKVFQIYCNRLSYNHEQKLTSIIAALDRLPHELVAGMQAEFIAGREMLRNQHNEYLGWTSENIRCRDIFN